MPRPGQLRIVKNLAVISVSICLLFTAYDGLSMLQSTMNRSIGTVSQAVLYLGFCLSSLLLPKYVIKKVGCKWTLVLSSSLFVPYIAANFLPTWATMMPSALLMGVGASLLWGAQCTYFNESALMYCTLFEDAAGEQQEGKRIPNPERGLKSLPSVEVLSVCPKDPYKSTEELVVNEVPRQECYENPAMESSTPKRRFSVTLIAGDLENVSSKDATNELDNNLDSLPRRSTVNPRKSAGFIDALHKFRGLESVTARFFGFNGLAFHSAQVWSNLVSHFVLHRDQLNVTLNTTCACGADFCDPTCLDGEGLGAVPDDMRFLLTGISVGLSVVAVAVLVVLLAPLPADKEPVRFSFRLILATFDHCRRSREQQLLVPISFYVGMVQGFYTADFTKSFVGCSWGASHVGLVTVSYGAACALSASASGLMVKYVGRIPLMALAQVVNVAVNVLLLVAPADHTFYVTAAMLGVVLGTFWTLLPAFYGVIFKKDEEAAFGAYYLWSSLGWFLSFSYSDYICTSFKMYVLIAVSSVGFLGFLSTERMYAQRKTQVGLKYAD